MFTPRQLDRLWNQHRYADISSLCMEMRAEGSPRLLRELEGPVAAAALGLIRLDEISQPGHPLAVHFLRRVLLSQQPDGSFGSPLVTALCLRALLICKGDGLAVHRGMEHLAALQREDGLWPQAPVQRMPSDPLVTAFILHNLLPFEAFRSTVRVEEALRALQSLKLSGDPEARHLTNLLRLRHAGVN